jgi:MoxR-like ATPase
LFANIVLADEINRTPPKTQAALLEAMQEYKVTYGGVNYDLDKPFLIIATQNPIEQSGTYPLPEAQLDRFLLFIKLYYPSENEELEVLKSTTAERKNKIESVFDGQDIIALQRLTRQVHIDDRLIVEVNNLVRNSRPQNSTSEFVKKWCEWGAGPRAGQALILCAKARAVIKGRFSVIPEDIHTLAYPVLRHRISLNFRAEAEGVSTDDVVKSLLKS